MHDVVIRVNRGTVTKWYPGSFPRPPEVPTDVSNGVQMYLVALGCSDTSSQPCTMSFHVFLKTIWGTGPNGTREHLTHITELVHVLLEGALELRFLGEWLVGKHCVFSRESPPATAIHALAIPNLGVRMVALS